MHPTLFRILAVLRPAPAAAATLLDQIRALDPDSVPSVPTFYRHLREGVESRWIEILEPEDEPGAPGRPSQSYALTAAGAHALQREAELLVPFTRLAFGGRRQRGKA
jgi:DNA-binding PadR family transcriptional regulator